MKSRLRLWRGVAVLCIFLSTTSAHSQPPFSESLITALPESSLGLNASQEERLRALHEHPHVVRVLPIRLGNLSRIQRAGALPLSIPGVPGRMIAVPDQIAYTDENEFVWEGTIPQERGDGYLRLIAQEGKVFGSIYLDGTTFEIRDLGARQHVLIERVFPQESLLTCGANDGGTGDEPELFEELAHKTLAQRAEGYPHVVRVLVVYTPAAQELIDPEAQATQYILETNSILSKSGVGIGTLRYELAGVEPWNFTENLTQPDFDREVLRDDGIIANYREQYEADVVVGLVAGKYERIERDAQGNITRWVEIAGTAVLDEVMNKDEAHVLVRVDVSPTRYTFAHELAHLFECRHDSDPSGAPKAHGYTFWADWKKRYTVMATGTGANNRIMHFSNPWMSFLGKSTGTEDNNYNVSELVKYAPIVSEYFGYDAPMSASMYGDVTGANGQVLNWCVNTSDCDATPSYSWAYSLDGFSYQNAGSGTCYSRTMPTQSDLWVRVTITCPGENTITLYQQVVNESNFCRLCRYQDAMQEGVPPFGVFPNPATDKITLSLADFQSGVKNIQLIDVFGRLVYTGEIATLGTFQLSVAHLPAGQYWVAVQQGEVRRSQSFIKRD